MEQNNFNEQQQKQEEWIPTEEQIKAIMKE